MKKLLLLLCSIGANAAFADSVLVKCSYKGNLKKGESEVEDKKIATLTGGIFSKQYSLRDLSFMHFLSFAGNYDEYLDQCIMEAGGTQKVLGLKFTNDNNIKYIPINPNYERLYDIFKDNPKLAAFAEVKSFGSLVAGANMLPISKNKSLSVKIREYNPDNLSARFNDVSDIADQLIKANNGKLKQSKVKILKDAILHNASTRNLTSTDAEEAALFLSRYLHDNNGLLDNLPFSYGLTRMKTADKADKNAVSEVEIEVVKNPDSISLMVKLYLQPSRLITQYNPDVMAKVTILLNIKNYRAGDEKQQLTIEIPKTGPLVEFYTVKTYNNARAKKVVDDRTQSELLALMVLGTTNLYINPEESNSDKWISKDLIKEVGGSGK